MARRIIKLSDFDPNPIIEYAITERDLTLIHQYLRAMQSHLGVTTWDEIGLGSYYGTSALLHEVVELRILLNRDPYLITDVTHRERRHLWRQASRMLAFPEESA